MPEPNEFIAQVLESGARSFAAGAAERLLEICPSANAFGQPAFPGWQEHLVGRLLELGGAMRVGEPDLFADRLHWARVAFESRGMDSAELTASVEALASVLGSELPPGGSDAVAPYLGAARAGLTREFRASPPITDGPHGALASRYMLSLLEGDRAAATELVVGAVDAGMAPMDALLQVLVPVSVEIGRMWHLGEVGVGEEHFITHTTSLLLGALRQQIPSAVPNGRAAMIATLNGNHHDLAGTIAGLLLESEGWRVVDLGTEIPGHELVKAAGDFGVDVLILGVMLSTQVEAARNAIALLKDDERTRDISVIVGGHVFDEAPDLWQRIGADAHARTIQQVQELSRSVCRDR